MRPELELPPRQPGLLCTSSSPIPAPARQPIAACVGINQKASTRADTIHTCTQCAGAFVFLGCNRPGGGLGSADLRLLASDATAPTAYCVILLPGDQSLHK